MRSIAFGLLGEQPVGGGRDEGLAAVVLIVVSIVPIWLAQRLSGDSVAVSEARVKADES